jgi:UDP-2,3-diacylglucosamine pyrophosphatase LpxH
MTGFENQIKKTQQNIFEEGYLSVVSDLHIGGSQSVFLSNREIEEAFNRVISKSKHVFLNGDIFELFQLKRFYDSKYPDVLKNAINGSIDQLTKLIEDNPKTNFYYVLGNHENIGRFRNKLDKLTQKFPDRFFWHPEAILLGENLAAHGDLQGRSQTDFTRPELKFKDLINTERLSSFCSIAEKLLQRRIKFIAGFTYRESRMKRLVYQHLKSHAVLNSEGQKTLHYFDAYKKKEMVFDINAFDNSVRIFTGHTHIAFGPKNDSPNYKDKRIYNTGGTTFGFDNTLEKLNFFCGWLNSDGTLQAVENFSEFQIQRKEEDRFYRMTMPDILGLRSSEIVY